MEMEVDTDDQWSVDKLPEEVQVEIFSFLSSKDLHELVKVRADWKTLINGNAKIREKLVLELDGSSIFSAINSLQNADLSFRYNTLEVSFCKSWCDASETTKSFSNDLRHLYLERCDFDKDEYDEPGSVTRFLRSLGNLEVLEMREVNVASRFANVEPLKLEKLKFVIIEESNLKMLKAIGLSQIASLRINRPHEHLEMVKYLVDFLCTQSMLEELALSEIDFMNITIKKEDIKKMNFPLKRLSLEYLDNFMGREANALAFVKKFANTLEELSLGGQFEKSFYDLIFKKLRKLRSLKLDPQHLPQDENFYKTLPTLRSVKKLVVLSYKKEHQKYVQGIIGHLPNIETLVIKGRDAPGNGLMMFVSYNLLKLRSLCINSPRLARNAFREVGTFGKLIKFDVGSLQEASNEEWSDMLAAMPNVEQLTIQSCKRLNDEKFDALTRSWTQLRVLNLGNFFTLRAQRFTNLLARCPNITTVRVSGCYANHPAFKDFKKPGLRLIAKRYINFESLENGSPTLLNYY